MKARICSVLIFLSFLFSGCVFAKPRMPSDAQSLLSPAVEFGISHPPLKGTVGSDGVDALEFSSSALARFNVKWISTTEFWTWRQPTRNTFAWKIFDEKVAFAKKHSLQIFLVIAGDAPSWACSPAAPRDGEYCPLHDTESKNAFLAFVEELLRRSNGSLGAVAFGNEWDRGSWIGFPAEEFIERSNAVFDAAKRIAPQVKVVAGSLSVGYLQWEAACAGLIPKVVDMETYSGSEVTEYCAQKFPARNKKVQQVLRHLKSDAIDLHLYDDPENWTMYVERISRTWQGRSLWISEFGGPNQIAEPYSEAQHALKIANYVRAIRTLPASLALHFKLLEDGENYPTHLHSAFFRSDLSPKEEVIRAFLDEVNRK
jgi:hypothetical protein